MDMRNFYKIVQRLRTGAQEVFPGMIEGKDGTTKTTSRDIMREVVSFYSDISKNEDADAEKFYTENGVSKEWRDKVEKKAQDQLHNYSRTNTRDKYPNELCWARPTSAEVGEAVRKAAPNKATGDDQIPAEALKHMEGDMLGLLTHLIGMMWDLGRTPASMSKAITTLLQKRAGKQLKELQAHNAGQCDTQDLGTGA